jgi:hypothetical protein
MKLNINIESYDADATDDPHGVAVDALRSILEDIAHGYSRIGGTLHDRNGNRIGSWLFEDTDDEA